MKLILTGHYAGQTITINGSTFVKGELPLKGDLKSMDGLIRYMATYNAFLAGSDELAEAQERDRMNKEIANGADTILDGEGTDAGGAPANDADTGSASGAGATGTPVDGAGSGTEGDGVSGGCEGDAAPQTSDPQVLKIIDALKSLNPDVTDHWTDGGLPRVAAVEAGSGVVGVTRKDIEAALPGWNRDKAIDAALADM